MAMFWSILVNVGGSRGGLVAVAGYEGVVGAVPRLTGSSPESSSGIRSRDHTGLPPSGRFSTSTRRTRYRRTSPTPL